MGSKKKNIKAPKDHVINVRCTEGQKTVLETIASKHGLGLSSWLLHVGLVEAERLRVASKPEA